MTTQQPEALRLADAVRTHDDHPRVHFYNRVAAELLRLHAESEQHLQELRSYRITVENREARIVELEARVRELEASQERLPLSADEIKEPKNGEAWRAEWWNESLRMMLPSEKVLHSFNAYGNGTIQFTIKARTSGTTQEKQG